MKRLFDFLLALVILFLLFPIFLIILFISLIETKGSPLFWSERVGRLNKIFKMPKFRTMRRDAPQVATHLLDNSQNYITTFGTFLRKSSLDELPQLWSILKGDMSFVGPRPALFNQYDLIELRTSHGIELLTPGLTGWAQINGRDEISIEQKVQFDLEYMKRKSLSFDFYIILKTFVKVASKEDVKH